MRAKAKVTLSLLCMGTASALGDRDITDEKTVSEKRKELAKGHMAKKQRSPDAESTAASHGCLF